MTPPALPRSLASALLPSLLVVLCAPALQAFSPPSLARLPGGPAARRCAAGRRPLLGLRAQSGPPMDKEPLEASEENVNLALMEAKETLGTIFGNSAENREIGITGDCQLVDLDGPFVTVRLVGRFWHKRVDVLSRVDNYLRMRIPELIEVNIEDPRQLDDSLPENQKA